MYLRQSADTIVRRLGMRSRAKESSFLSFVSAAVERLDEFVGSIPAERVLMVSDDVNCEEVFTWLEHRKGIYTYA